MPLRFSLARRELLVLAFSVLALMVAGGWLVSRFILRDEIEGAGSVKYGDAGFTTVTIAADAPVRIGVSTVLSGGLSSTGEAILAAASLAGEGKKIGGHAIEFVGQDDQCSASGSTAAAGTLLTKEVVAVIGPSCPAGVIAAQPQYELKGVSHISPSSTDHKATYPDRDDTVYQTFFRIRYNDDMQAAAQAAYARKAGVKSAFIVYNSDSYGTGIRDAFKAAFEKAGGTVAAEPELFTKGTTDFASTITNIRRANPDLVYFAGAFTEAGPFITQLRAANKDVKIYATDAVKNDNLIKTAGKDAEGVLVWVPTPTLEGAQFESFNARFQTKTGKASELNSFTAESFDAATAIVEALTKVAKSKDGKLTIDLAKLNQQIRKSNFKGAAGPVQFNARGENIGNKTPLVIYQVQDGKFTQIP